MADLTYLDKKLLEDLLGMRSGYVLDFSDATYEAFFRDLGVNIEHDKYHVNGRSKAKRMRAFWQLDSNAVVGKVLKGLLEYAEATEPSGLGGKVDTRHWAIVDRLLGGQNKPGVADTEGQFLQAEFGKLNLAKLMLDRGIEESIRQRLGEIRTCLSNRSSLAVIILSGSTLEGLLLNAATQSPSDFNQANAAPRVDGKVKRFHEWTLSNYIDVAYELDLIGLDVKKFSHSLRDFRNYIHPYEQVASRFTPDEHTARISWQVLCAAIADLSGTRRRRT